MTAKVFRQESKEFQMKVLWPVKAGKTALLPGITDRQIFKHVSRVIATAVSRLAGEHKATTVFNDNLWRRDAVRYDTAKRDLKQHDLTLLESELSFKVDQAINSHWDCPKLQRAAQLYLELQKTDAFQPVPPIFFFNDPVSSTAIRIETV